MSTATKTPAPEYRPVPIGDLMLDPDCQPRAEISRATVADYREDIEAGASFESVVAFFDGSTHWVADGFHRVEAFHAAGFGEVPCEVHRGGKRDAILFSLGANGAHGLRRTNADKRRAVTRMAGDPEWSRWSDKAIARQCRVSADLVAKIRGEVAPPTIVSDSERTRPTIVSDSGRPRMAADGRTMNTANIGRKPAPTKPLTRTVEAQPTQDDSEFYQGEPWDEDEPSNLLADIAEAVEPRPTTVVFAPESLPVREPVGSSIAPREAGEDDPETEEEWIATLPLARKLHGEPYKRFVAAARLHWRMRTARDAFRTAYAAAARGLSNRNPLAKRIERYLKTDNPKYWHVCPPTAADQGAGCDGLGRMPGIGEDCPVCYGNGFTPEYRGV